MKTQIQSDTSSNLINILSDSHVQRFLGRTACLRIEVLAAIEAGRPSLYAIAKEYGVSPQAVSKIAKRARQIMGMHPPVD